MSHFKRVKHFTYPHYGTIRFHKYLVRILTLWRSIIGLIWIMVKITRCMKFVVNLRGFDLFFELYLNEILIKLIYKFKMHKK